MSKLLEWKKDDDGAWSAFMDGRDGMSHCLKIDPTRSPDGEIVSYRTGVWTLLWSPLEDLEQAKEVCQAYADRNSLRPGEKGTLDRHLRKDQ